MLNHKLIVDEYISKLQEYKRYLPICLHMYVGLDYYNNISQKDLKKYYDNRTQLQREDSSSDFLLDDLKKWLRENPEFKEILIEE